VECGQCGAQLEIEEEDLRYHRGTGTPYGCEPCLYTTCPCCSTDINWYLPVLAREIPHHVQRRVMDHA
jgi:hypothetical protein